MKKNPVLIKHRSIEPIMKLAGGTQLIQFSQAPMVTSFFLFVFCSQVTKMEASGIL